MFLERIHQRRLPSAFFPLSDQFAVKRRFPEATTTDSSKERRPRGRMTVVDHFFLPALRVRTRVDDTTATSPLRVATSLACFA
ncbi:hypothetical protein [Solicola gregarius]|uniref:Uncharacterized protein n=1 Tax=Solicola gregarius TaxID=2908642 RepID=A0AA46TIK7_9ACTN|nr:hypothetical protein [Solicola gregarius]UYM05507.1 hypothetical protein L0C25_23870 [Solicola gregarius]